VAILKTKTKDNTYPSQEELIGMKLNNWTKALAALGVVSMASAATAADETVMTAVSGTTLSGYVSTSAIWKPGTGNALTPGKSFNDAAGQDGFNIDAVSVAISKPIDEGEWSAGYKAELFMGPDAGGIGSALPAGTDFAVKQAYVDLRVPVGNGIDLKMGLFDTIIGYEYGGVGDNPIFSRSLGWSIEPTSHTGFLASYTINDMISVMGGIAESYNAVRNLGGTRFTTGVADESEKSYMGAISITAPESAGFLEGANLYLSALNGLQQGATDLDTTHLNANLSLPMPIEGLSLGFAFDYRFNGIIPTGALTTDGSWETAIAGYVSYAATEKLTVNYRADYGKGSDGAFGAARGVLAGADDEGTIKIMSNTISLDYKLWENVVTRVEGRYDRSLSGTKIYGGQAAIPNAQNGADPDKGNLSFVLNVIYYF
jgi:hypothetical protein